MPGAGEREGHGGGEPEEGGVGTGPRTEIVGRPIAGRTFTTTRRVRLGDVAPSGRLRLDAVARYLQDLAGDDATPIMGASAFAWIVRRTTIQVHAFPRFDEDLELTTWGSGIGSRWAERRSSIIGAAGGHIEAAVLWIHVDIGSGRPKRLPDDFVAAYAEAIGGRAIGARLGHGEPVVADGGDDPGADRAPSSTGRPWTVRRTDLDLFGHVNNASYWSIAEEAWDLDAAPLPWWGEVEHRDGLALGQRVEITSSDTADERALWIFGDDVVAASILAAPTTPATT